MIDRLALERACCYRGTLFLAAFCIIALCVALCPEVAQAHVTEMVNVSMTDGDPDYGAESSVSASYDGRFVAFASFATDLVPGDTNAACDVFVRDMQSGTTSRVSVATDGTQGNNYSAYPCISADGRYVAFMSYATNLVSGDTNGAIDVFVRDRATGTTSRVSLKTGGTQGNGNSQSPSISGDGRYVAFTSEANNLVPGDTNGQADVFVRDRIAATTVRASVNSSGTQANNGNEAPAISSDGRYVAFQSSARNLVSGDNNGMDDIFIRDLVAKKTYRVSLATSGAQANNGNWAPAISSDGRYVAFRSYATNLVPGDTNGAFDVFLRDRQAGTTTRVSVNNSGFEGNKDSGDRVAISADGRYIAFISWAYSLAYEDGDDRVNDIFVHNRVSGVTERVTEGPDGSAQDGSADQMCISGDGSRVAFTSGASNLLSHDTDHGTNVFAASVDTAVSPVTYESLRGSDRFGTALKISQAMFPSALPTDCGLVLAPGETFPEALCGAPLATAYGGPVLLNPTAGLNNAVRAEIIRLAPTYVICVGLSDAIVAAVQTAVPAAIVSVIRGEGGSGYDMSRQVANSLADRLGGLGGATAIITPGDKFPDAIGVSPLACCKGWPILLTDRWSSTLHASAAAALSELGISTALKVGTFAALPGDVTGLANLSGSDRYVTNSNLAEWAKNNADLVFTHVGLATGDKFPDALAAGPYLALDKGILLLSPLLGPLPTSTRAEVIGNMGAVQYFSFIAMIEPVVSQVKELLP